MDRIGRQGLQLFVDAGCPVDNDLVSELTKQVLLEKIQTMLGQRPEQDIPQLSTGATTVLQQQQEEEIEEELPDQVNHGVIWKLSNVFLIFPDFSSDCLL